MRSESVAYCTFREFDMIEVPIWPGITTEHLICGALSRRSLIKASVNPFTANLAALYAVCHTPIPIRAQKALTTGGLTEMGPAGCTSMPRNAPTPSDTPRQPKL